MNLENSSSNAKSIGIVGLGQIGGSLARALLLQSHRVVGFDSDWPTCTAARTIGLEIVHSLAEVISICDPIICCVSINANSKVLKAVFDLCDSLPKPPTVSDASSYKLGTLPGNWHRRYFIPGHPMAGTHKFGFASSIDTLFVDSVWNLIVEKETELDRLCCLLGVITSVGAFGHLCSQQWHDRAMSIVSGLPHFLALALARTALDSSYGAESLALAAGSFKGATRVLQSNPFFVDELLKLNAPTLLPVIQLLKREIGAVEQELVTKDSGRLRGIIQAARDGIAPVFDQRSATSRVRVLRTAFGEEFLNRITDRGILIKQLVADELAVDLIVSPWEVADIETLEQWHWQI